MENDRFWSRVDQGGGPNACWPWLGAVNAKGYGRSRWQGATTLAHRVAVFLSGATVPDGHTVDHLCRNRICVNPAHLEVVPHRVNLLRGDTIVARAAAAMHCPAGHLYDATSRRRSGKRVCRECGRTRNAKAYVRTSTRRSRPWLTDEEKARVRSLIADGLSHSKIAKLTGLSVSTISRVRNS